MTINFLNHMSNQKWDILYMMILLSFSTGMYRRMDSVKMVINMEQ